jgi:hypothetical protein
MIGRFFRRLRKPEPPPVTIREELLALLEDVDGDGRPSHCKFCERRPFVVVYGDEHQHAFLCDEHIGPFFLLWTGRQIDFQVVKL